MSKIYDVIVLGAGPAGLAAGLYAGRSRLSVLIVEKGQDGGQISITDEIENYPGQVVDQPESGPSLIARMKKQLKEVCLLEQAFVRSDLYDGDVAGYIADVAKKLGASIKATGFIRYAKGEGLQKKEENYAEEIAKMTGK